jgi:DNA end-binding protein Ku
MAPIWKGAISFGLVTIPVHLESAVRDGGGISFRQLHKDDLSPIEYKRFCKEEGEPVDWNDIVKGYEYAPDKYVVIDKEDLEAATPPKSKSIDILDFVAETEIDPRYFEKPYYLLPEAQGTKAYALLREAIRETGMVGIGKLTMRGKQYLVAIHVQDEALVLETMRFADELVETGDYKFPEQEGLRPQELTMARQLIENLAEPFDPSKYHDEYRERIEEIIEAKLKGRKIKVQEEKEPEGTKVVDLVARLEQSLAMGKRARNGGSSTARRHVASTKGEGKATRARGARSGAKKTAKKAAKRKSA